jgi:hypothetical protein
MSQNLASLLTEIEKITTMNDLIAIQQTLTARMQTIANTSNSKPKRAIQISDALHELPGTIRRTREEAERFSAQLKALLPPEEQHKFGTTDFTKLKIEGKSWSQRLIDDREEERY